MHLITLARYVRIYLCCLFNRRCGWFNQVGTFRLSCRTCPERESAVRSIRAGRAVLVVVPVVAVTALVGALLSTGSASAGTPAPVGGTLIMAHAANAIPDSYIVTLKDTTAV